MPIKHILNSLLRNRAGVALIILQIAITAAIISNALFIIDQRIEKITRPTGIDVDNIIVAYPYSYAQNHNLAQQVQLDIDALQALPGVIAATPITDLPLSNSGWSGNYSTRPSDDEQGNTVWAGVFVSNENGINALGLELIAGRNFTSSEIKPVTPDDPRNPQTILISQALANALFPNEEAVGKTIWTNQAAEPITIIGIYRRMFHSWINHPKIEHSAIMPLIMLEPDNDPNYLIRSEAGQRDHLMPIIEKTLSRTQNRILQLNTLSNIKDGAYRQHSSMVKILCAVVLLLLLITSLSLVGLASFNVNRRRKQIGTRRALGARKRDILSYFVLEITLISGIGVILGGALAFTLNYALVSRYQINALEWAYPAVTIILMIVLAQLAVLAPAKRASEIDPAIATRSV